MVRHTTRAMHAKSDIFCPPVQYDNVGRIVVVSTLPSHVFLRFSGSVKSIQVYCEYVKKRHPRPPFALTLLFPLYIFLCLLAAGACSAYCTVRPRVI